MKNFLRLALCLLFSCVMSGLFAQDPVATGGCNSVSVDVSAATNIPSFPNDLYWDALVAGKKDCVRYQGTAYVMGLRYRLQKFNPTTQSFNQVAVQITPVFNNLDRGRYRVMVDVPVQLTTNKCISGKIDVYNTLYQLIGSVGTFGPSFSSNEVLVGNTGVNDVSLKLGEVGDMPSSAADFGEQLLYDARDSKHHTHYKFQILREDGAWWGGGWKESSALYTSVLDLEAEYGFVFWPNYDYYITLVLKNEDCYQTWRSTTEDIYICPSGTGCKENYEIEDKQKINFFPNPADTNIELQNIEINSSANQYIIISDMSGKVLLNSRLSSNYIDISNFMSGMYIINILEEGELLLSDKLVIR